MTVARNRQREDKDVSNNLALLIRLAKMILDFNRVGSYTQPGREQGWQEQAKARASCSQGAGQ